MITEQKEKEQSSDKEKAGREASNFSNTIKNAHAAGDGSLGRSDEAVEQKDEEGVEHTHNRTTY